MQTEATLAQSDVSELDLVKRCQAGDTEAFDELVTRCRTRVFGMIYNIGPQRTGRMGSGSGELPQSMEVDWTLSCSVILLHLDLSHRHERDDRLVA